MKPRPPHNALNFLRWFCREDYLEEIEGDLLELFEERCQEGSVGRAKRRFAWDVLRSFRYRNIKSLKMITFAHLMLGHYLKIGGRNFLRQKGYSFINVAGLSIGITCCLILLIFVKYESGFDNFHPQASQTYRVVQHTQRPEQMLFWNTTAYPLAEALRSDFHEFELVTQTAGPFNRFFSVPSEGREEVRFESEFVLYTDPFYPQVFALNWLYGNKSTALQHPNSVVLTERIAKKCFGDDADYESLPGKTILLNGKDPLQVTGIIEDTPGNTNLRYEILVPYEFFRQNNPYPAGNWSGNYGGTTFVVLPEDDLKDDIESRIAAWKKKYLKPEDDQSISYFLQPLNEIHTETLYGSSPGGYTMPKNLLRVASSVGIFILLIAIANFINLVTARSAARAKEVGIRRIIGSTWVDLIRQFTLENTLLVIVALILAAGMTGLLLGQLNVLLSGFNLRLELQWGDAGLVFLTGLLTILLGTIYPAVVITALKPLQILKGNIRIAGTRGFTVRKSLIVFQFVIVQVLVIAAIIIASQMNYFRSMDLGFASDAVITIPMPESGKLHVFGNALRRNKDIEMVSFGSGPPMAVDGFQLGTTFRTPGQSEDERQEAEMKIGDANYLAFYDLELISGRNFSENREAFDEFIVNERLLKSLGWSPEEAIGQKLVINEGEATITGVVRDYHNNSLQHNISPCIILNWNYFLDQAFVRVSNLNPESMRSIEAAWKETFSTSVFRYDFLDDAMEREYIVESLFLMGFSVFSTIAVVIGCLGLTGLMAFMTVRRTKEVGIRKVLGASVLQIITLFSKELVVLIALTFAIAVPLVYYFMQLWLEGFVYRIDMSAWMFLGGGALTLLIVILTLVFQTTRAAVANPVESLRTE